MFVMLIEAFPGAQGLNYACRELYFNDFRSRERNFRTQALSFQLTSHVDAVM